METKIQKSSSKLVIIFLTFIAGLSFFERTVRYQDEINYTFKASRGVVHDYAVRPFYYLINLVFDNWLGTNVISLQVVGALGFILTGYLIYRLLNIIHPFAAWLSVFLFAFYGNLWLIGVQAMPHIVLAAVILLILNFYFDRVYGIENCSKKSNNFFLGLALGLCLSTHSTSLAFIAAMVVFHGLYVIFHSSIIKSFVSFCCATLGGLLIVAINEVGYRYFADSSYINSWIGGSSNLDASKFKAYFKPWDFYLLQAYHYYGWLLFIPIIVFVIVSAKILVGKRIPQNTLNDNYGHLLGIYFSLFFITATALAVLSIPSWKFDRVFVSYSPLVAIMIGLSLASLPYILLRKETKSVYLFLTAVLAVVFFTGISNFDKEEIELKKFHNQGYQKYSALYDYVRSLPGTEIGFIGAPRFQAKSRTIEPHTDKQVQIIEHERFIKAKIERSISNFFQRGFTYINVSQFFEPETHDKIFGKLYNPYCHKVYEYLGFSDIWNCLPYRSDNKIVALLAGIPRTTRVVVMDSALSKLKLFLVSEEYLVPMELSPEKHGNRIVEIMKYKGIIYALLEEAPDVIPNEQGKDLELLAEDEFIGIKGQLQKFYLYKVR